MLKGLAITCVSRLLPLIGTGMLSAKGNLHSLVSGREHELSRAGTALRPELARSGLLNYMMGKVFQEDKRR
jgi:hypothetical protein